MQFIIHAETMVYVTYMQHGENLFVYNVINVLILRYRINFEKITGFTSEHITNKFSLQYMDTISHSILFNSYLYGK